MNNFVRKQKYLERFNGKFKFRGYNLLEHSYMVTYLFIDICKQESIDISSDDIFKVMNHDILEVVTTDIPYDIKHLNKSTEMAWDTIEYHSIMNQAIELSDFTGDNLKRSFDSKKYDIFKVCDFLDLWMFCKEEIELGNNGYKIIEALVICEKYLQGQSIEYKSIIEIMKNFKP